MKLETAFVTCEMFPSSDEAAGLSASLSVAENKHRDRNYFLLSAVGQ